MTNSKYFIYIRKSTDEEDRQVLSLEAQLTELKEFAQKEHLEILEVLTESKTAKVPGRPVFDSMVKRLENKEAQGIISWHPDRLARNSIDGGKLIYLLDIGLLDSLKFPTFWFDNTPQGKFMLNIAFGQSKYYVDNLSENVRRGIRQKLRRGQWPGLAPLGYYNHPKTRTVEIDELTAPKVHKLFELYATGHYVLKDIIKAATALELFNHKGKPLGLSTIQHMFKNLFYYGLMKYDGETYQGQHTAIVDKKLFEQVNQQMTKQGKPHKYRSTNFDLLNLAKCGECGCTVTAQYPKGNGGTYTYYRCTKKKTNRRAIKPPKDWKESILSAQV